MQEKRFGVTNICTPFLFIQCTYSIPVVSIEIFVIHGLCMLISKLVLPVWADPLL